MTKKNKVEDVAKLLNHLNIKSLEALTNEVYRLLAEQGAKPSFSSEFDKTSMAACVHCGSDHFVKNGKDGNGNTRYLCRKCGKTFTALTNTALSRTRKSIDVWKLYVENLLEGRTLTECAKRCGISLPTAHVWRHKILNALSEESFDHEYSGLLEMDEMFVRISYKGNHTKSKNFVMPREAHKRGSDSADAAHSNHSKASVLCVVERGKRYSAIVPCRGVVSQPLLEKLFKDKLSDDSIVMTDGYYAYKNYLSTTNAQHIVLKGFGGNAHQARVIGPYHINNVNAMHHRFRDFLRKYNGVSTKFLSNYLALFLWQENHRNTDKKELLCDAISTTGTYVSAGQLRHFAPAPDLAPRPVSAA